LSNAGLIELAIVFGIVLAIALFDLVSLRRSERRRRDDGDGPD
jgi:MFS superfamily sulfate permease-like transporter